MSHQAFASRFAFLVFLAAMTTSSATAQNTTLYVDASVAASGDGSQAAPFLTLQEAIAVPGLTQGDEILLAAGEYIGNFVPGSYEIRGVDGPEQTILRSVVPGIVIDGQSTRLTGVTIAGTPGVQTVGVMAGSLQTVLLDHCIVRDHEGTGIVNNYGVDLRFCTIVRNAVAIESFGSSITVEGVYQCLIQDNLSAPGCSADICDYQITIQDTSGFDPGFWDADANDFHLRPGSNAIGISTSRGIVDLGALPFDPAYLPESAGEDFCFGDGGDGMGCTPCACMNDAPAGTVGGCLNEAGRSARLLTTGTPRLVDDTLHFDVIGASADTFAILASAETQAPANSMSPCFGSGGGIVTPFFDGLRCIVQNVQRHGTRPTDANGDVGLTTNGWGFPDGPGGGLVDSFGGQIGQERHFYVVYRSGLNTACATGFNTTQATSIVVAP